MQIGKAIKILRKRKEIRQLELAKLAKLSQTSMCMIENCQITPNYKTVRRIAEVLKTTPAAIYSYGLGTEDFKDSDEIKDLIKHLMTLI